MNKISFIGTREFSSLGSQVQEMYLESVTWAVQWGYTVSTGAAKGADQVAANRAIKLGGSLVLYLPWWGYEKEWIQSLPGGVEYTVYSPKAHPSWGESVGEFHPNPKALSRGARALHARNFGIIEGSKAVIAVSRKGQGGTAQGLRIARSLGIPTFDLFFEADRASLRGKMRSHPSPKRS